MKKKYYWIIGMVVGLVVIVSIIIAIILSEGRGVATLKCVLTEKDNYMETVSRFQIKFKNDKMTMVETETELNVKNETLKENIDKVYNTVENQFKQYKNEKGVTVKTQKWSDGVRISLKVDAKSNPDRATIVGSGINSKMSYEDAKKSLTKQKYTCS